MCVCVCIYIRACLEGVVMCMVDKLKHFEPCDCSQMYSHFQHWTHATKQTEVSWSIKLLLGKKKRSTVNVFHVELIFLSCQLQVFQSCTWSILDARDCSLLCECKHIFQLTNVWLPNLFLANVGSLHGFS